VKEIILDFWELQGSVQADPPIREIRAPSRAITNGWSY
jgi:hypothetical protein